jgi:hypothetical protein
LPDLVHERLDAEDRAAVLAHVEHCDACRAELSLLRELRRELSRAPTVDVGAVARGVVARTVSGSVSSRFGRSRGPPRRWMDWRIAAAITVLVVGGASVVTLRTALQGPHAADTVRAASVARTVSLPESARIAAPPTSSEVTPAAAELSMGGGVADLSDNDLRALLADIQGLDAMLEPEPEPVTVRVSLPGSER